MRLLWTAEEMVEATGGTMRAPFAATGVCIDSRQLQRGDLFIALAGDARDGHAFVVDALARGAAGALIHRDIAGLPADAPVLLVDDTLAGLTRLGAYARARFTGRVVAVTGSVGKTTTKEMLRTILTAQGTTHAAVASFNNHWGVPVTLARLPADAAWCVVEIGMNHAGEIKPLAKLARPHVALITTIERTHIGHLGSIEAIADEKISIARGLDADGVMVLPADSSSLPRLLAAVVGKRVVTFGASAEADAKLLDAQADAEGTSLEVDIAGRHLATRLAAPGLHMAMDALAALTAATALGADPAVGARALAGFTPVAGRGARRQIAVAGGTALLLDESYNASTPALHAALAVLRLQPARRRIAVLGDMLELGDDGPAEHIALAADVAASADLVFTCGPLMRHLHTAIAPAQRGAHAPDSMALAPIVAAAVAAGDAILIKGSLGSGMKHVVAALPPETDSGVEKD